ncbi:Oxidoreductase [hydrothermal vent metagenome]|uniref:Oxidoreductase n=1 Tax=hydrothermal vent metagenome TaxID=652676 RepID=A0A3B1CSJ8_9ZZZZ
MDIVKWGIIGCGDVTEVKSGPAFQLVENSELIAVMRRNGRLAKDYAERHKVARWYDDAASLLHDPNVNAIYIATPPSSHSVYTIAAANVGKPVYVEKPMAMSYEDAKQMVKVCNKNNVPLFVAYYRRALPRFLKVRELLEEKKIGDVKFVNIRYYEKPREEDIKGNLNWRIDPKIAGCGYFCDLGSHIIDLIQFLLGDITEASGHASNQNKIYKAEDIVTGEFIFRAGVHGTGIWSFNASEDRDEVEIVGSKGKITYSTFMNNPVVLYRNGKKEEFSIPHPKHIQQFLIDSIVKDLRGGSLCPSTGKTAIKTAWVMDKLLGRI